MAVRILAGEGAEIDHAQAYCGTWPISQAEQPNCSVGIVYILQRKYSVLGAARLCNCLNRLCRELIGMNLAFPLDVTR